MRQQCKNGADAAGGGRCLHDVALVPCEAYYCAAVGDAGGDVGGDEAWAEGQKLKKGKGGGKGGVARGCQQRRGEVSVK